MRFAWFYNNWPLTLAFAVIVTVRGVLSAVNPVGMYHGGNEAWYIMIANGYASNPWTPNLHGYPFYDTPPLLTYLIYASSTVLGWNEFAARLPSMLAWLSISAAAYLWWKQQGDTRSAQTYAFIALILPWTFYWAGRAQTDMLLAAAIVWYVVLQRYGHKGAVLSGFVFAVGLMAKQPMVLALPVLVFWPRHTRPTAILSSGVGSMFVAAWWVAQWLMHPVEVERSVWFHTGERASLFGNAPNTLLIGLAIASGGVLLYYVVRYNLRLTLGKSIQTLTWSYTNKGLFITAALFALFALANSPLQHEYYTVPVIAMLPLLAPPIMNLTRGARIAVPASIAVCLIFSLHTTQELGNDPLEMAFDENVITHVQSGLTQQAMYYGVNPVQVDDRCTIKENGTYLCRGDVFDQRYCYFTGPGEIGFGRGIEICPNHCVHSTVYNDRLWVHHCGSFMGSNGNCWEMDGQYQQMVLKRCEADPHSELALNEPQVDTVGCEWTANETAVVRDC